MRWLIIGLSGVVAALVVAAIFGPHEEPTVTGFAEVLDDSDDDED